MDGQRDGWMEGWMQSECASRPTENATLKVGGKKCALSHSHTHTPPKTGIDAKA